MTPDDTPTPGARLAGGLLAAAFWCGLAYLVLP